MSQNKVSLDRCNPLIYYIKSSFIWVLKINHITSERSNQMTRAEIDWLYPTVHEKDKFLRTSSGRLLRASSDKIFHCTHIVRTFSNQLLVRSGVVCLLVEVVYWPCGWKFVCPTINFAFLGIIIKAKLPAKFYLHSLERFCLQISSDAKYFPHLSKTLWSRINNCYSLLFSNLNKKRTQHYY